jgi:hypothetical protein
VLNFFVFDDSNRLEIYKNIFYLSSVGLSTEHLLSIPIDIFHYYIKLYNIKREHEEKQKGGSGYSSNEPKPIGEVIPRG